MRPHITEAMVEARVAEQLAAQARRGVSLPIELTRGLARTHLEMTAHSRVEAASPQAPAVEPLKAPARALPAPLTPVLPLPIVEPAPAAVIADRVRMAALVAMTAKGAEAEAECREAMRTGMTPEQYASTVAARSILDAVRASRGQ